jgi:uncharacterized surface protein with fasciclin (FAS1) repeats
MLVVAGLVGAIGCPPVVAAAGAVSLSGAPAPDCASDVSALRAGPSSGPELSIFLATIEQAGLADVLAGEEQFTIFAPSNAAFEKIPINVLEAILADVELLRSILTYHVVPESLSVSALVAAGTATTLNGDQLRFALDGDELTINGFEATVVCADVASASSTVHVIDSVLIPRVDDLVASAGSGAPTTTTPTTVESTTPTTVESTTSTSGTATSTTVQSATTTVPSTPAPGTSPPPQTAAPTTPPTVASPTFADPPSPASGHAEVVAQGLVAFSAGEYHWAVTTATVTAAASALGTTGATFVIGDGPGGVMVGPSGGPPQWRLAPGEALFDDVALDARTVAAADAAAILISPATGAGPNPFTPGEGLRDVDLVRDVLGMNEALLLQSDVSVLILVTQGAVSVGDTNIPAGSAVAMSGDITLINRAAEPAVVLAVVVGPLAG